MPAGRPRKSAEYHRLVNNYRPSRHAERPVTPPETEEHKLLDAELKNWSMAFSCGRNFFTWDHDIGVDAQDEAAFLPAARAAWERLGRCSWQAGSLIGGRYRGLGASLAIRRGRCASHASCADKHNHDKKIVGRNLAPLKSLNPTCLVAYQWGTTKRPGYSLGRNRAAR